MEIFNAIGALGALVQQSRLKIFRLLIHCGPGGMAAGDIARQLKLPQNTLSLHIATLSRARLVMTSRKEGCSIISLINATAAECCPA